MTGNEKMHLENLVNIDLPPTVDFEQFMENLRTRLNVLNTSVFLLEDNLKTNSGNKTLQYIQKINLELQRIRNLINQTPEQYNNKTKK